MLFKLCWMNEALLGTRARGGACWLSMNPLVSLSPDRSSERPVVQLRYFGGLTVEKTAQILQVSAETGITRLEKRQSVAISRAQEITIAFLSSTIFGSCQTYARTAYTLVPFTALGPSTAR